jgi:signal transduction histidine kinase
LTTDTTAKNRFFPFAPRIIHKGLALVIIPLVVNTVWICLLNNCLDRTAHLADVEREQSKILQHINACFFKFAEVMGSTSGYFMSGDKRLRSEASSQFLALTVEVGALDKYGDDNPNLRQFARDVLNTAQDQYKVIDTAEVPDNQMSFNKAFVQFKSFKSLIKRASSTNKQLQYYVVRQQAALDKVRESEVQSRESTRLLVAGGLLVNFLLAIALALYFIGDITKRLAVLVDNARRLPKSLSLNQTVPGRDELNELDQALHQAASELASAREYRSSLMQMLAHDLRSPLSSCSISLDLFVKNNQQALAPAGLNQVKSMSASLERLVSLVSDFLLIEKLEQNRLPLELAPENLKELTQTAIDSLAGLSQAKSLTVINAVPKEYVLLDRERIMQVLVNYLSNAIKFSPRGGKIEFSCIKQDQSIQLSVLDQGQGISEADVEKLFQRFNQLKAGKKAGGSGLGLAMCKLIVQEHGGAVGVDSASGQGARFWFTIPLRDDDG